MVTTNDLYIGIDIGKTKISTGIVNLKNLTVIESIYEEYSNKTKKCILAIIEKHIYNFIKSYSVKGIGISSFGIIDKNNEVVISSKYINEWNNVQLAKHFRKLFGIQNIFVFNDVVAACVGEYYKIGNIKKLCYISVGTSIGISAIIDGKILDGAHNLSGQIAHIKVKNGQSFSELCGGIGIERNYFKLTGKTKKVKEIFFESKNNDMLAKNVREIAIENLTLLANIACLIIDPEGIIFGGGVMQDEEFKKDTIQLLEKKIKEALKVKQSPYLIWNSCGIYEAAILGGAILCHQHVK